MGAAGAAEIANAGLKRVSVYQNLHNSYSKFSTAIAAGDATDAIAQAKSVGHSSSTGWGYNTNFNDWNMHQTIEVTFGGNFMRLKELESKMDGRLSLIINLPF